MCSFELQHKILFFLFHIYCSAYDEINDYVNDSSYETSDGQTRQEQGGLVGPDQILTVHGSYSYTDSNGNLYEVMYIADDKGFRIITEPKRDDMVSLRIPAGALASLVG